MLEKPYFLEKNIEKDEKFKSLDTKSQRAILSLRDNGYCIFDLEIDGSFFEGIIKDCQDEYAKVEYEGAGSLRIQDAFSFSENVKNLALNSDLLDFLRFAYGREPIPFQTLNFEKGSEQSTHSDTIHFNTYPYRFMCGIWVALEDVDSENGPLHYYPGSHKLPVFGMDQFSLHGTSEPPSYEFYPDYEEGIQQLVKALGLKKESVTMKRGECMIWAANLLHGGDPIVDSSRTRHSQVTHYFFEDCFFYTPMLSSVFRNDFHIRRPINILKGGKISEEEMEEYAKNSGIDLSIFNKANDSATVKKKSFLSRLVDK